jgi:hypothetical protein
MPHISICSKRLHIFSAYKLMSNSIVKSFISEIKIKAIFSGLTLIRNYFVLAEEASITPVSMAQSSATSLLCRPPVTSRCYISRGMYTSLNYDHGVCIRHSMTYVTHVVCISHSVM